MSSQIEGTQSSLSDLLLFEMEEAPGVRLDDVTEVSNYAAALEHGLARVRNGFPLSNRLIREVHDVLLSRGRGAGKAPGEFRRCQNWIGGTRPGNAIFVPPPPDDVPDAMAALERFLHDDPQRTPTLAKAALAHVQFETIHPFLDGNGRVGRLLITLVLCAEGVLRDPLLSLSLYFKQHRQRYYELLNQVRTEGDWEAWLHFFSDAVRETAGAAVTTARAVADLFGQDRERVRALGRPARDPRCGSITSCSGGRSSPPDGSSRRRAFRRQRLARRSTPSWGSRSHARLRGAGAAACSPTTATCRSSTPTRNAHESRHFRAPPARRGGLRARDAAEGVEEALERRGALDVLRSRMSRTQSGKTIIVTTLQKFPVIAEEIGELPGKRFALIVDEAHSSQSGESTKSLKAVLASRSLEEAEAEDETEEAATATPQEELEGKTVCVVSCQRSPEPVFLK